MTTLARTGDQRAVQPLMALAHSEVRSIPDRAGAVAALGRIAEPDGLPFRTFYALGLHDSLAPSTLAVLFQNP